MTAATATPYDVTGAAHDPAGPFTRIRVEGFAGSVAHRGRALAAALARFGAPAVEEGPGPWAGIRDAAALGGRDGAVCIVVRRPCRIGGEAAQCFGRTEALVRHPAPGRRIVAVLARHRRVQATPRIHRFHREIRAQRQLRAAGLQALTPEIPVLSEESRAMDIAERRQWRRFWLVDPLDGTREFVKRNGEFTVNIALIEDGVSRWGVIQQPVTGELWHGGAGIGAFRRDGDRDEAIRTRAPAPAPLRIAASRSHRDARTQALIDALPGSEIIGCGSSLKFCRIAEGAIDLYPRFGPTSEWDTAAGQAILEAAGGAVLDPQGRPFRYNQRNTLLNGDFIALGDPLLRDRLPA